MKPRIGSNYLTALADWKHMGSDIPGFDAVSWLLRLLRQPGQ